MENIFLTNHSKVRLYERYDIEKIEVCKSVAERAWRNGRTPECFPPRMRKYLLDVQHRENKNTIVKVHAKNCYIFSARKELITVYSIADNYDYYVNTLKPYKSNTYYDVA